MNDDTNKNPSVAAAASLDRIGLRCDHFIDTIRHVTPDAVIDELVPGYRSIEAQFNKAIYGSLELEREHGELVELVHEFVDLRSALVWKLAGPVFLRLAGHTDQEIERICSTLGLGAAGNEERRQIEG